MDGCWSRRYDRWGQTFLEQPQHDQWLENPHIMAFIHAQQYGVFVLLTFIATIDVSRARARSWSFALLGALLFYELNLKYDDADWDFLMFLLPQWTIHEKVQLLHVTVYFLLNLGFNWAAKTYIDIDEARFQSLFENQILLGAMVEDLLEKVDDLTPGKKREGTEAEAVPNRTPFRDFRKIKRGAVAAKRNNQQQQQQQQAGGVNWLNLIILLLTLYTQWR